MRSLSDTLERLARLRATTSKSPGESHLARLGPFGSNPGALSGWLHVPEHLPSAPALVVVLHGCTQTAAGYDVGSGWSKLADDYGFVVLFPEQVHLNNANLCFNWFNPDDITRDHGEVLSIRQMIDATVSIHGIDERRIHVTGLSAGGAMANAMLATYPEVFAGGAIIAGLAHAVAATVPEAFDRMRGHGLPNTTILQAALRKSSDHHGPWPTVSIWHGVSDNTVVPVNAAAIVEQWRSVHGVSSQHTASETVDGHVRAVWRDKSGRDAIEFYQIRAMAHGTPLDVGSGYGRSGPFMLDVGISSTVHIARSWGLAASFERRANTGFDQPEMQSPGRSERKADPYHSDGIQAVIEKALRSAGLMR